MKTRTPGHFLLEPILRFDRWLFGRGDPFSLEAMRVLLGSLTLVKIIYWLPHFHRWFSDSGVLNRDTAFGPASNKVLYTLLEFLPGDLWLYFFLTGTVISALCFTLGFFPRVSGFFLYAFMVSIDQRNEFVANGADRLLRCLLFPMIFANLGNALSPQSRFGKRIRQIEVPLWPQRLIQIQMALMYLSTIAAKLMYEHSWKDLYAVRLLQSWTEYRWIPIPESFFNTSLPEWATLATLIIELLLGTLIFVPRFTKWIVLLGIALHLGISVFTIIPLFGFLCMAGFLSFFPGETVRNAFNEIQSRIETFLSPRSTS